MTNEQFMAAFRSFIKSEGIGIQELANRLNKPLGTVNRWVYLGIKKESWRKKIVDRYPHIFQTSPVTNVLDKSNDKMTDVLREVVVLIKIEQALMLIVGLSDVLNWFLFEATQDERNRFRDSIPNWSRIRNMVTAMTNEHTLEVIKNEGGLR